MATTTIHPINVTLHKAIDYILNENKTDNGMLVSSLGCTANGLKAEKEFDEIRRMGSGRTTVLAQHMIQSFLPGEVTPEQAHLIGTQLAEKLLGNSFQYVIATHIDKHHIHNHIIFNEVDFVEYKSFETLLNRGGNVYKDIQKYSDELCLENELNIIKNPELGRGMSHYEWEMDKLGKSWKSQLRNVIDTTIMESDNFDDFLKKLRAKDVEVVYRPENVVKIKFRMPGQQKFARGGGGTRRLGWYYDAPQIEKRIEQSYLLRTGQTKRKQRTKIINTTTERMQQSKGLQRWADIQNMKEASKILNILTAKGIADEKELENRSISTYGERVQIVGELNDLQARIDDVTDSIRLINQYYKYKPIKDEYRRSTFKKKFAKEHEKELNRYDSAVSEMAVKFPDRKVPPIEKLHSEKKKLIEERNAKNAEYKKIVAELKELDYVRQTIQDYLDKSTSKSKKQEL